MSDSGESLMVLLAQQSAMADSLTWSNLHPLSSNAADALGVRSAAAPSFDLAALFRLLQPLLGGGALADGRSNGVDEDQDDFVLMVLRRYAFRILERVCARLGSHPAFHAALDTLASSSSSGTGGSGGGACWLVSSLVRWSVRATWHFADAVNSIDNLENRIKAMAVFEREHDDDRHFKVREKKKKIDKSATNNGNGNGASDTSPSKQAASLPIVLPSFSSSLSVHHGTCYGVGHGLCLDRSSNLQLVSLPEHRSDKRKREKAKTADASSKADDGSGTGGAGAGADKCGREDIIHVASLQNHHAVLTAKGKVFHAITAPSSPATNCTSLASSSDKFVRLAFGTDKTRIVQVCVGAQHTLLLTSEGRVWLLSDQRHGGSASVSSSSGLEPQLVDEEIGGQRVLLIGAGAFHSFALTHRGLYAFGNNAHYQLGLGHSHAVKCPTLLRPDDDVPVDSFVQIVGGAQHTLALSSKGSVFSWGSMGLNEKGAAIVQTSPTRFVLPTAGASDRVIQICAAEHHSLFLTDQGHVYAHAVGPVCPGVLGGTDSAPASAAEGGRSAARRIKGALATHVVTMVTTSRTMSAALTQTNEVFIMGLEVYKGRPTPKDVALVPTILARVAPPGAMPVVFIAASATMLLTLLSAKKQARVLSTAPLTVQPASNNANTLLPPYPSLACLVGDDAKFYFAKPAPKQQQSARRALKFALASDATTAEGSELYNGGEADTEAQDTAVTAAPVAAETLLDMVTASDGLRGRHTMLIESVPTSAAVASAAALAASRSPSGSQAHHVEGVRIFPHQRVRALMALNTVTVPAPTLQHYSVGQSIRSSISLPGTTGGGSGGSAFAPQLPSASSAASAAAAASASSGAAQATSLPVGFTMSIRVCNLDLEADSRAASNPVPAVSNVFPTHPLAAPSSSAASPSAVTHSPLPSTQMSGTASPSSASATKLPMTLLSVQLPVDLVTGQPVDVAASAPSTPGGLPPLAPTSTPAIPRALELCCDVSLSRFSLALLHAEKFHFIINLEDSKAASSSSSSSRSKRSGAGGDKEKGGPAAEWHTVTLVCSNVDRRLMVKVFIDGFCYLRCTDPRPWAARECDLPLSPSFMPHVAASASSSGPSLCTLPITLLEGWNGRCSDASVWLHALSDAEVSHVHASGLSYLVNDMLEHRIFVESQQMHALAINRRDTLAAVHAALFPSNAPLPQLLLTPPSSPTNIGNGSGGANGSSSTPHTPSAPTTPFHVFVPAEDTMDATVCLLHDDPSASDGSRRTLLSWADFKPSRATLLHVDPIPAHLLAHSSATSAVAAPAFLVSPPSLSRQIETAGHKRSDKPGGAHGGQTASSELVLHVPPSASLVVERRICATEPQLDSYTLVLDLMLLRRPSSPLCVFQSSSGDRASGVVHLHPDLTLSVFGRVMSGQRVRLGVWHRLKLSVNIPARTVMLVLDHFCVAGYKFDPPDLLATPAANATSPAKLAQLRQEFVLFARDAPIFSAATGAEVAASAAAAAAEDLGLEVRALQVTRKSSTLPQLLAFGSAHAPFPSMRNVSHATRSLVNQGFPPRWSNKAFVYCDGHRRAASAWLLQHAAQLRQADEESQLTASVAGLSDIGLTVAKCKAALLRSQRKQLLSSQVSSAALDDVDASASSSGSPQPVGTVVDYEKAVSWLLYHADADARNGSAATPGWDLLDPNEASRMQEQSALAGGSTSGSDNWQWKLDRAQLERPASSLNPTYALLEDGPGDIASAPAGGGAGAASKRGGGSGGDDASATSSSHPNKLVFLRLPLLAESEKGPESAPPPLIIRHPMLKKWQKHRSAFLLQRLDAEESLVVLYARRAMLHLLCTMDKERAMQHIISAHAAEAQQHSATSVPSSPAVTHSHSLHPLPTAAAPSRTSQSRFLVHFLRLIHCSYFPTELLERFAARMATWMEEEAAAIERAMEREVNAPAPSFGAHLFRSSSNSHHSAANGNSGHATAGGASLSGGIGGVLAPLSFPQLHALAPLSCALIEELIFQLVIIIQHAHDESTSASASGDPIALAAHAEAKGKAGAAEGTAASASGAAAPAAPILGVAAAARLAEGDQPVLQGIKSSTPLLLWLLRMFNALRRRSMPAAGTVLNLSVPSAQRRLYLLSKHLFCPPVMNLLLESVVVCVGDTRLELLRLLGEVLEGMEEHTPTGRVVSIATAVAPMPDFSASPSASTTAPIGLSSPSVPTLPSSPPSCPSFCYAFLPSKPWLLKHLMLRLYAQSESKNVVWSATLQTIIELNMRLEHAARAAEAVRRKMRALEMASKMRRRSRCATVTPSAVNSPLPPHLRALLPVESKDEHEAGQGHGLGLGLGLGVGLSHSTPGTPMPPSGSVAGIGDDADEGLDDEDEDEDEEDVESAVLHSLILAGIDFPYRGVDFDRSGIVQYLGDNEGTSAVWTNPATLSPPKVKVTSSGRHTTYSEVLHLSRTPVVALTSASQNSWICFDFLDRAIVPTHYTLRHYTQASYALRNWVLEGSTDGEEWTLLRTHTNDTSLAARDATKTWALDGSDDPSGNSAPPSTPFRKFRVRMTGPNSSNSWHLVCSGFEIFGKLIDYGALNAATATARSPAAAGTGAGGAVSASGAATSTASSALTNPANPLWFHKVMLSQQYMLAFNSSTPAPAPALLPPAAGADVTSPAAVASSWCMWRIPEEFARAIWSDFQSATGVTDYLDKKVRGNNTTTKKPNTIHVHACRLPPAAFLLFLLIIIAPWKYDRTDDSSSFSLHRVQWTAARLRGDGEVGTPPALLPFGGGCGGVPPLLLSLCRRVVGLECRTILR